MNKFKKFIITKILRESIFSIPEKPLIVRERLDIETVGISIAVSPIESVELYYNDIGSRLGAYLIKNGFVEITVIEGYTPFLKEIQAKVDVVRRSKND